MATMNNKIKSNGNSVTKHRPPIDTNSNSKYVSDTHDATTDRNETVDLVIAPTSPWIL